MPPGRGAALPQAEDTSGGCTKAIAAIKPPSGTNPGYAANFHFKMKKAPRQRNGHCYLLTKSLEHRKTVKLQQYSEMYIHFNEYFIFLTLPLKMNPTPAFFPCGNSVSVV